MSETTILVNKRVPNLSAESSVTLLVGEVASGKTTLGRIFTNNGFGVIDADMVAKGVIYRPENFKVLRDIFGTTIFHTKNATMTVDLKAVAHLYFVDHRESLSSFGNMQRTARRQAVLDTYGQDILIAIKSECKRLIAEGAPHVVVENAIGLAQRWHEALAPLRNIIAVTANYELRKVRYIERTQRRDPSMSTGEAALIFDATCATQWKSEEIEACASIVIRNNSTFEDDLTVAAGLLLSGHAP
jgi:dephospho-CoA kinase